MREWLYGRQAVREMLRAQRRQVRQLIIHRGSEQGGVLGTILALAQARSVPVVEADRNRLDQLSERANHQGMLAEVSAYPYVELDDILDVAQARGEPPFVLCLDHLQDPQNLGTLLRTAEAVGVHIRDGHGPVDGQHAHQRGAAHLLLAVHGGHPERAPGEAVKAVLHGVGAHQRGKGSGP